MTERALPAIGVGVRPRPGALPRPVRSRAPTSATPPGPRSSRREAILNTPARAGMLVGASAAVYALTLAGVSGLQAETDASVAAARAPYQDIVAQTRAANDELEARILEGQRRGSAPWSPRTARSAATSRPTRPASTRSQRWSPRSRAVPRPSPPASSCRPSRCGARSPGARGPAVARRGAPPPPPRPAHRARPNAVADRRDVSAAPPAGGEPAGFVTFSARALGSALRLTVHLPDAASSAERAADHAAADAAWADVRAEFDAVDVALSRFRDDSELTMLNRLAGSGRVVEVSWRTRRALAAVDRAGRVTDGRFDATVLGALERIGEHGAILGPAEDAHAATVPRRGPWRPALARARATGPRRHGWDRQGPGAALGLCAGPAVAATAGRPAARGRWRHRRGRSPSRGRLAHRGRGSRSGRRRRAPRRWSWWSCGRERWRRRRSASGTGWPRTDAPSTTSWTRARASRRAPG